MFRRGMVLIVISAGLLAAADGNQLLPPDLKHLSTKQFNQLLSKAWSEGEKSELGKLGQEFRAPALLAQSRRCAIPLENYQARDRDPAMAIQVPLHSLDHKMIMPLPVPVCK